MKPPSVAELRKALAATGAAAAVALAYGLIDQSTESWIRGSVATGLAFLATYAVKGNEKAP